MAISKIKLGTGDPINLRDSASMHYAGHGTDATEMHESSGVYTSSTTLTGISATIVKNDYITLGTDRANYVCTDVTGTTATWALLSEAAAEVPVKAVKVNGTALVPDTNGAVDIPAATDAAFGVVETGSNITNTNGVISIADASTTVKGVVQLSTVIPSTGAVDTKVATEKAVADAISELPQAMIFRGSLGTGGTVTDLPTAAASTAGDVYKVIVAGTYGGHEAQVGDLFICQQVNGDPITYSWVLIPSGDVPAGTVTSVGVATGANSNLTIATGVGDGDDPITASGTITVGVAAEHTIPADTDITSWNDTATEVASYTTNNSVMTGVAVAGSQGTGGVLVMAQDSDDAEQLNVLYVNPTTVSTAVFKPVTP